MKHVTGATKKVHKAKHISPAGKVSALCFKQPRAIRLAQAVWTIRDEAVTCPGCLALMKGSSNPPCGRKSPPLPDDHVSVYAFGAYIPKALLRELGDPPALSVGVGPEGELYMCPGGPNARKVSRKRPDFAGKVRLPDHHGTSESRRYARVLDGWLLEVDP